jgi:pantothenate kinase
MEALFLEHEGYFGALGAFLQSSYTEELVNKEAPLPVPSAAKLRKQQT